MTTQLEVLLSAPVLNSPYRRSKIPHPDRIWVTKSLATRRWPDCCEVGTWTRFAPCTGKASQSPIRRRLRAPTMIPLAPDGLARSNNRL